MKVVCLMALWIIVMIVPTFVRSSSIIEEIKAPNYETVPFDLQDPESYSQFLTNLRNNLRSQEQACQVPVTRKKTIPDAQRFVLVNLIVSGDVSIVLGIDVTDLYVWAYRDKYEGRDRANFLKHAPKVVKDNLFKEAPVTRDLPFGESYGDLQGAAKLTREKIELGVPMLTSAINKIFGTSPETFEKEAKFLIIAIQMVSEATRFKYIENQVVQGGLHEWFLPNKKFISLENSWGGSISEAIHKSSGEKPTACVNIDPPLQLTDDKGKLWEVSKVSEIKPDMAFLKFKKDNHHWQMGFAAVIFLATFGWYFAKRT